jgi:hypothetical protein
MRLTDETLWENNIMMLSITADCRSCNNAVSVFVHADDYRNYFYNKQLVQNVWPDLTADEREVIIGHSNNYYICGVCWDDMEESE